jgi:urease subunit gamma/beta
MEYGATLLNSDDVLPGVASLVRLIQVEAMFPDGTKMVSIHEPIRPGSRSTLNHRIAGEVLAADGDIQLNQGRRRVELSVFNHGDRPVQIGSHYHFFEVNKELEFNREQSFGMRLDVPSGVSTRFEPGQEKIVVLVEFGGAGEIHGFNGLTNGSLRSADVKERALIAARTQGYRGA